MKAHNKRQAAEAPAQGAPSTVSRDGNAQQRFTRTLSLSSIWSSVLTRQVVLTILVVSLSLINVGTWAYSSIQSSARENLQQWLGAELDARLSRLEIWMELRRSVVARVALAPEVRKLVTLLRAGDSSSETLPLVGYLKSELELYRFETHVLLGVDGTPLHNEIPEPIFAKDKLFIEDLVGTMPVDDTVVTGPIWVNFENTQLPLVFIVAPVLGLDSVAEGYLLAGVRLDRGLAGVITAGQAAAGTIAVEGYAYDEAARLISTGFGYGKAIELGGPLAAYQPDKKVRLFSIEAYTSHSGNEVVSASTWVAPYRFGLVVEVPSSIAFRSLRVVMRAFLILSALMASALAVAFLVSMVLLVLDRRARSAEATAERMGQYTLDVLLGKGGMGEVYLAKHTMLRRPVALKLIRTAEVPEQMQHQFEREVQSTAVLSHPNTIQIFDYGRTSDNIFYYVMEYLEGFTLKDLVQRDGPQSPARVVHILAQICSSLHEAHLRGFLHRDVKPANIMLCHLGGEHDVVKVLDFGLVKGVLEQDENDGQFFAGTVKVIAPEVAQRPNAESVQSDIYSVGVVGYYLLTGKFLFDENNSKEYMRKLVKFEPTRPSTRINHPMPADLEQIIMMCLNRAVDKRPASAAILREQLLSCSVGGQWTETDAGRWWAMSEVLKALDLEHQDLSEELSLLVDTRFRGF